ncbi:hypothetical protein ACFLXE_04965 [Chloroflexota bacterium]
MNGNLTGNHYHIRMEQGITAYLTEGLRMTELGIVAYKRLKGEAENATTI